MIEVAVVSASWWPAPQYACLSPAVENWGDQRKVDDLRTCINIGHASKHGEIWSSLSRPRSTAGSSPSRSCLLLLSKVVVLSASLSSANNGIWILHDTSNFIQFQEALLAAWVYYCFSLSWFNVSPASYLQRYFSHSCESPKDHWNPLDMSGFLESDLIKEQMCFNLSCLEHHGGRSHPHSRQEWLQILPLTCLAGVYEPRLFSLPNWTSYSIQDVSSSIQQHINDLSASMALDLALLLVLAKEPQGASSASSESTLQSVGTSRFGDLRAGQFCKDTAVDLCTLKKGLQNKLQKALVHTLRQHQKNWRYSEPWHQTNNVLVLAVVLRVGQQRVGHHAVNASDPEPPAPVTSSHHFRGSRGTHEAGELKKYDDVGVMCLVGSAYPPIMPLVAKNICTNME